MSNLQAFLAVSVALFTIGLYGLGKRPNLIAMLITRELLRDAASRNQSCITRLSGRHGHY